MPVRVHGVCGFRHEIPGQNGHFVKKGYGVEIDLVSKWHNWAFCLRLEFFSSGMHRLYHYKASIFLAHTSSPPIYIV